MNVSKELVGSQLAIKTSGCIKCLYIVAKYVFKDCAPFSHYCFSSLVCVPVFVGCFSMNLKVAVLQQMPWKSRLRSWNFSRVTEWESWLKWSRITPILDETARWGFCNASNRKKLDVC